MTSSELRILNSRVDVVTFSEALDRAETLVRSGEPHHVVTANTLMLLGGETDPALRRILEHASLVIPESWGVAWASRRVRQPLREFIPGIDFMTALCARAARNGWSVFLLGAQPGVAERAGEALRARYPGLRIAGTQDGYFTPSQLPEILSRIQAARPELLFVGMNMPAQEKWIATHLPQLSGLCMGVGGSFDVLSGRLKRAPLWMRRLGIEWVYRTLQQPWRFQRIKGLPVFMWRVLTANRTNGR
jgi:N-acetylglucosaminyldiphosphoundecaprenol N-acetyl-beta-D-mannosaminyltransferase